MNESILPQTEREALIAALKECSDELAEWVTSYYYGMDQYPSEKRRFDRDMEPVLRARALLESLEWLDG